MPHSDIRERLWIAQNMTNTIALGLGLTLLALIGVDLFFYGTQHMIFLGKKLFELIDWLAFWR